MGGRKPVVVAPYDAELYGHWWFEGPWFLDSLIRKVAHDQKTFRLVTPSDYLAEHPENQVATPSAVLLGRGGLRQHVAGWLQRLDLPAPAPLRPSDGGLGEGPSRDASTLERRALNQAARELLLAQASDWAFIMKTGTMVDYAVRRTKEHVLRFLRLHEQIRGGTIDEGWLAHIEGKNNLFPEIDYRVYRPG